MITTVKHIKQFCTILCATYKLGLEIEGKLAKRKVTNQTILNVPCVRNRAFFGYPDISPQLQQFFCIHSYIYYNRNCFFNPLINTENQQYMITCIYKMKCIKNKHLNLNTTTILDRYLND